MAKVTKDHTFLLNQTLSPRIPEHSRRVRIPTSSFRNGLAILVAKVTKDHAFLLNQTLSPRNPERSRRIRLSKTGMVLHPPPSFQKKQKKSKNSQKKRRICLTLFRFACIFSFTVATTGLTKSQPLFDRNSEGKQRQNFICQQKESVKFFNRPENQF